MYNKNNFTHMFGSDSSTNYLLRSVLHCKKVFDTQQGVASLDDLLTTGDSWCNLACIDKLTDLGYIQLYRDHDVTNYKMYRNLNL